MNTVQLTCSNQYPLETKIIVKYVALVMAISNLSPILPIPSSDPIQKVKCDKWVAQYKTRIIEMLYSYSPIAFDERVNLLAQRAWRLPCTCVCCIVRVCSHVMVIQELAHK